ncbi:MAG TPA: methyltransferase domain-containing protein [Solirubrobacteraceae bacterium]|nr:methyltransferase domain-containing protein [Solirubrobacteraceae bacterium]
MAGPIEALGHDTLDRLELRGDETVLDAGCGTGTVTERLLARLPRGRVLAVDGSAAMVQQARRRLGPAVEVRQGDLVDLTLEQPVDAILSTATFHWIPDHPRLFTRLRRALVDGGRLVAQCGGEGNIATVRSAVESLAAKPPYQSHLGGWEGPWRFAGATETEQLLAEAGFARARCWLTLAPVTPEDPAQFLTTMILGAHLDRLPRELGDRFVANVLARLAVPVTIDYVRLNIDATA